MRRSRHDFAADERGTVAIQALIFSVLLFGTAGLVLDSGRVYAPELRRALDPRALQSLGEFGAEPAAHHDGAPGHSIPSRSLMTYPIADAAGLCPPEYLAALASEDAGSADAPGYSCQAAVPTGQVTPVPPTPQ